MEHRFEKRMMHCLRRDLWQVQERELTQEVRLTDGMPDIGSVISSRGQCILRMKEWDGDCISVTGGVTVWILYDAADGTGVRMIESWIPMQLKWDLPDARREGSIRTAISLCALDVRSVSARKMMVRADVSALAEILEPMDVEMAVPVGVMEDIQVLRCTFPAELPVEAGEKSFQVEELLDLPGGSPDPERILSVQAGAGCQECRVVGGKVVFRGDVYVHLCYQGDDGALYGADLEVPYSQFTELDREYGKDAMASVMMSITNLEPELVDGKLSIKCAMVAQYLVDDVITLELAEDAYSNRRQVKVHSEELMLPVVLEKCTENVRCQIGVDAEGRRIIDGWICPARPKVRRAGGLSEITLSGTVGVLYEDPDGTVQGVSIPYEHRMERPMEERVFVTSSLVELPRPVVSIGPGRIEAKLDLNVDTQMVDRNGKMMVTSLEVGDPVEPDPGRPSVVIRRSEGKTLWELAKENGSTTEDIRKWNGSLDENEGDRLLLIPVR